MTGYSRICISNSVAVAAGANQLRTKFIPGDIVWIKIHNSMWWPAQIVDQKSIGTKPVRRSEDEILVRLYGSYEYSFVDPFRCSMEFENIVQQDNITAKELFQQSLEKEISGVLSAGSSKRELTHFREATAKSSKGKTRKQRRTAKIGSSTLGIASPEQEEKGDARVTATINTNTKQYKARKQRINKNYRQENFEGNSTRQGTPANPDVVDIETEESSGVKSTAGYCLRRSLRNARKNDGMEKNKAEYLKYQNAGTCISVNLELMDEVRTGASNNEDMQKLGSAQLKHKVRNRAKEKFLQGISKEQSDNPIEYGTNGNAVTKPEIFRTYTLRKRKQKGTEAESTANVGLEIRRGENKGKIELERLDSADRGLSGDLLRKTIKPNVIQELNINGPSVHTRNMISEEASRTEIFNHGEAGKQKLSKLKVSGAFIGKDLKQSGLRKQNIEASKKLENIDSSICGYPASESESVEDIKARKLKVMQCLGLVAPSGSPFR